MRIFLIVLLAGSLIACSTSPTPKNHLDHVQTKSSGPTQGDWIVMSIPSDPDTLNPVTCDTDLGRNIIKMIFQGLVRQDPVTLEIKPELALTYEISPDKLVYTFHLRRDIKWQDGIPLTAEDVKYTFDRIKDPKVDASNLRSTITSLVSCEVIDPYTVRFKADQPYYQTLISLDSDNLSIIPKHVFSNDTRDFNQHPFGRHPIGSGPYSFVSWETDSRILLKRNPLYLGDEKAYPNCIAFQIIPDPFANLQLLKKGDVDFTQTVSPIRWERQLRYSSSMKRLKALVYDYPTYNYLGFNLRREIFKDVRVRHALDLLIPRQGIMDKVYLGYARFCSGFDPISSPDYNLQVAPTPNDPALAMKLFHEAGWDISTTDRLLHDSKGNLFKCSILSPSSGVGASSLLELIQEAWKSAGIDIQILKMDFPQMITRVDNWDFDTFVGSWATDLEADPYQLWHSSQADIKGSGNFLGYKSTLADELIKSGREEYDPAKRHEIFKHLHAVVHDDYPACFLFNPRFIMVYSDRIKNITTFPPRPCYNPMSWWVPADQQKYTETPR